MAVDYEKIIRVYIDHVSACEGTHFLHGVDGSDFPSLTADEVSSLLRARDDVEDAGASNRQVSDGVRDARYLQPRAGRCRSTKARE